MDEIAAKLNLISELTVYSFETDAVKVPAAIVDFPEEYQFDTTMARGSDRLTLLVHAVVSNSYDRIAKDRLNRYVNGSGTESFKKILESGVNNSFDSVRVMSVRFNPFLIGQIEYKGATFLVDIFGVG